MKFGANSKETPLCPSAQPEMADSVVFGVVAGTVEEPRVRYLAEPLPVTEKLLSLTSPVKPTEVFPFCCTLCGERLPTFQRKHMSPCGSYRRACPSSGERVTTVPTSSEMCLVERGRRSGMYALPSRRYRKLSPNGTPAFGR
jgi:hypothetical protein